MNNVAKRSPKLEFISGLFPSWARQQGGTESISLVTNERLRSSVTLAAGRQMVNPAAELTRSSDSSHRDPARPKYQKRARHIGRNNSLPALVPSQFLIRLRYYKVSLGAQQFQIFNSWSNINTTTRPNQSCIHKSFFVAIFFLVLVGQKDFATSQTNHVNQSQHAYEIIDTPAVIPVLSTVSDPFIARSHLGAPQL